MAWPNNVCSKIVAQYFAMEYAESAFDLLVNDMTISQMTFFNPDASEQAKQQKAHLVASKLILHMDELSIPLEADGSKTDCLNDLVSICSDGSNDSALIPEKINQHFKFADEA